MSFRFTNMETFESYEFKEENIKGGRDAAWQAVFSLYELKKREDAEDWIVCLDLIGLDFDFHTMEVLKFAAEVIS